VSSARSRIASVRNLKGQEELDLAAVPDSDHVRAVGLVVDLADLVVDLADLVVDPASGLVRVEDLPACSWV